MSGVKGLRQAIQQVQCVSSGDVLIVVLGESAQMALAPYMFSRTETIARWYVAYYVDDTAESATEIADGAQGATTAVDTEGGDRRHTAYQGEDGTGTHPARL